MAKIIAEGKCCGDCAIVIANADTTGISTPERELEVLVGIEELGGYAVMVGDVTDEFSWSRCDCCGTRLGGERMAFVVLD